MNLLTLKKVLQAVGDYKDIGKNLSDNLESDANEYWKKCNDPLWMLWLIYLNVDCTKPFSSERLEYLKSVYELDSGLRDIWSWKGIDDIEQYGKTIYVKMYGVDEFLNDERLILNIKNTFYKSLFCKSYQDSFPGDLFITYMESIYNQCRNKQTSHLIGNRLSKNDYYYQSNEPKYYVRYSSNEYDEDSWDSKPETYLNTHCNLHWDNNPYNSPAIKTDKIIDSIYSLEYDKFNIDNINKSLSDSIDKFKTLLLMSCAESIQEFNKLFCSVSCSIRNKYPDINNVIPKYIIDAVERGYQ